MDLVLHDFLLSIDHFSKFPYMRYVLDLLKIRQFTDRIQFLTKALEFVKSWSWNPLYPYYTSFSYASMF